MVQGLASLEQRAGVQAAYALHVAAAKTGKVANPPPAVGGPLAVLTVVLGLATSVPVNEQQAYLSPKDGGTAADFQQVTTAVSNSRLLQAARDAAGVLRRAPVHHSGDRSNKREVRPAQVLESSYRAGGTSGQIGAKCDAIMEFVYNPPKVPAATPLSAQTTPPTTAKLPSATNLPPAATTDVFVTQPDKQLQFQAPNGDVGRINFLGLPGVNLPPSTFQGPLYDQFGNPRGYVNFVDPDGYGPKTPTVNYTVNDASVFNQGVPLYAYPSGSSPEQGAAPQASFDFSDSIKWSPGSIQAALNATPQTSQQSQTYTLRLERFASDGTVIWEADINTFKSVASAEVRWQEILSNGNPNRYVKHEVIQDQY